MFFSQITPVFADCAILSTLKSGSRGVEVECLQGKIGAGVDGRFGPLTKAKVVTFQINNGLVPDGIFGPLSLAAYNRAMTGQGFYPAGCISYEGYSIMTSKKCDNSDIVIAAPTTPTTNTPATATKEPESPAVSVNDANNNTENVNPNLVNFDKVSETIIRVNKEKGFSGEELQFMIDSLKEKITTDEIDYNKEFEKMLLEELSANPNSQSSTNIFKKMITRSLSFLGIIPSTAHAAIGIPFGGRRLFSFFCATSANWMIVVSPLPPSYAVLLSYTTGTQAFMSYNIPITSWMTGAFSPPGKCAFQVGPYTVTIPTEGTIDRKTGSSPS